MSNFVRSYQFISPNDDQENDKIIYIYIFKYFKNKYGERKRKTRL